MKRVRVKEGKEGMEKEGEGKKAKIELVYSPTSITKKKYFAMRGRCLWLHKVNCCRGKESSIPAKWTSSFASIVSRHLGTHVNFFR